MSSYQLLADLIALVHFAYVAFVVVGLVLIWVGYFLRWQWVRGFWFRILHLAAMAVVVAESVLGITCPLTTWEWQLRGLAGQQGHPGRSFVAAWVHRLMFFDLQESAFTMIYVLFLLALAGSLLVVRPRPPGRAGPARRGEHR